MLSLPAIAGQAIDPLSQLMETAYIGRLGITYFSPLSCFQRFRVFHFCSYIYF